MTVVNKRYFTLRIYNIMHNLHRNSSLAFIRLHTSQALTNGRLGNQMSAFALVYSLGSKHGLRPLMWSETRKHFDEVFEDSSDGRRVLLRRFVFTWLETFSIVDLNDEELERRPRELKELDASVVQGFRSLLGRTPTSFPAQGSVRATSPANPRRNIRRTVLIRVHVRRTDYLHHVKEYGDGRLVGVKYFEKAMRYFRKKFSKVVFVVLSWVTTWVGVENNFRILTSISSEPTAAMMPNDPRA